MKLRWFLSGTVRQATEMTKHVRKLLNAQRDLLSPQALDAVNAAIAQTNEAINSHADKATLEKSMEELEKTANKWLKPYPNSEWRENVEVLLVAIAVAMAIRTFFLQPFKIPTGSMQPTLFGVTTDNLAEKPDFKIPGFFGRVFDACVKGTFYHEWIADEDGRVVGVSQPEHFFKFINKQTISVTYNGGRTETKTLWFTPDLDQSPPHGNIIADQMARSPFRKGEPILRFSETTGDHLFVNRLTYNFRRPMRGEIIVFKTKGIPGIADQNQFYIKRLVGMPGENLKLKKDYDAVFVQDSMTNSIGSVGHLVVDGHELSASTPHFESVYSFAGVARDSQEFHYVKNHYAGHSLVGALARGREFNVRANHYFAMGDNTMNSADSRYWDDLPQQNVIGKSWFVYWPITFGENGRFGWGQR